MNPPIYTPELGDKLCAGIAEGRSMVAVCKELGIHRRRVFEWLRKDEEFRALYEIAKDECADLLTEEMLEIADDRTDDPQSRRVRVDTRKWIASKLKPKKYGDKLDLNGKIDSDVTLNGVVKFVEPGKKDDDDKGGGNEGGANAG